MRKSTVFCEYASIQLKLKESQAEGSSVSVDPSDNLLDENFDLNLSTMTTNLFLQ